MVNFLSVIMALITLGSSQVATLEENYSAVLEKSDAITMQEEKLQIPPFVDGNYDFFDQTNGGVQPRFERKDDGTMGGAGQKEEKVTDANALFESKKSRCD